MDICLCVCVRVCSCMCVVCLHASHLFLLPAEVRRGCGSLELQSFLRGCEPLCDCGNQTWISYRSNQVLYLLSRLSSFLRTTGSSFQFCFHIFCLYCLPFLISSQIFLTSLPTQFHILFLCLSKNKSLILRGGGEKACGGKVCILY